jgi:energy-coupling factor transport system permease protein
MNNIVIGRYIPGKSFLYKMDPRTKIISLVILMIAVFMIDRFTYMFIALGLIIGLLLIGKISIKRVYFGLRPLMFLLLITFSFQIFFNQSEPILATYNLSYTTLNIPIAVAIVILWFLTKRFIKYRLLYLIGVILSIILLFIHIDIGNEVRAATLTISEQALETGFFIMMRLIIVVTLSTILTLTTKPTDLNLGLESVLKPLKIVRVNTEEMAMIIAISLRYIPTLLDEANKIMLAQASRGVDFSEGKIKDKIMQIISLLVPMFIISFKRSDDLANAMEARNFVPGAKRTRLHHLTWCTRDTLAIAISLLLMVTTLTIRIVGL